MLAADLHLLQPGELTQAGIEDRLGLDLAEGEPVDQAKLGLFFVADDADHLVEVEVDDQHPVQDVQPGLDLG